MMEGVLRDAGIEFRQVDALAISNGPGSFTGLRIGLSAAKGLAYAGGQKVAAVSTLEALAVSAQAVEGPVCACLDARKREVYVAVFEGAGERVRRLTEDAVLRPEDVSLLAPPGCLLVGDGAALYRDLIGERLRVEVRFGDQTHPRGGVVARMGWEKLRQGRCENLGTLSPVYVRGPVLSAPRTHA